MLTENFLNRTRRRWLRWIVKFEYYAGGSWHEAAITKKEITGDKLRITTMESGDSATSVTAVRIIDNNGDLVLQVNDTISKKTNQGILTVWEFPLREV